MTEFHFIRPLWLLLLLPMLGLLWRLGCQTSLTSTWSKVCDSHLLPYLIQTKGQSMRAWPLGLLFASLSFMIVAIAGPTWSRLPVPTYQRIQPRVVVLDMSEAMLMNDLPPDRLRRAKFKLHDLLQHKNLGQLGLVVYAGEPFVASPLTEDGQTIDALLSSLTTDVMPVEGQQLASALEEASKLITQAGFQHGQLLVLTSSPPSTESIETAKALANAGIDTSVMPILGQDTPINPSFQQLVKAGHGRVISFQNSSADLDHWLAKSPSNKQFTENLDNEIPVWRDQGRWFLIPALFFLLPAFWRGWVQRINI